MYIGVDLGTSSLKILLSDKDGNILDRSQAGCSIFYPKTGWAQQNPDDWYRAFLQTLKDIGKRHDLKKVRAVSFCGQMHGLVILDKDDAVIRPCILWNDSRAEEECEYLNDDVGAENLLKWTGNIAFAGFTAPKLLWLEKNERENFDKIEKIMLPKDYLVYKMSGVFASDVSDNSGTLYFDVENKKWSKQMLEILGINESQLPRIFESFERVGKVKPSFAKETGLNDECLVAAGGGDQAVGAIGTGTVNDGELSISLGTSGVVFAPCRGFKKADAGLHSFCDSSGKYHLMACMLSAAGSVDFWLNKILKTNDFSKDIQAVKNANTDDLYFLPYLSGERSPINDPKAKGVFYGLSVSTTREDLTKAVIEGVCFGLKDCYETMKKTGLSVDFAAVIGGGAKSGEWLSILADCLDMEIRIPDMSEGGGIGAIILAMVCDGVYKDVQTACKNIIAYKQKYIPNAESVRIYNQKYKKFKNLYKTLKNMN